MINESNATAVPTLSPVQFHEDTIYTFEYDGEAYTPVRPIIENIGLDWKNQSTKLQNEKERWRCGDITTPSKGGPQKMLCIPIRKIAAFLNTIQANRVRKDLREKLIKYQSECDEVLYNYWTKGKAINPRQRATTEDSSGPPSGRSKTLTAEQLANLEKELLSKMSCWNPNRHQEGRVAFHKNIVEHFRVGSVNEIPEDSFDELMQFIQNKYHHPYRLGVSQDIDNHCPNVIDDFIQYMLYRINGILEDAAYVTNSVARHNIIIQLTMITSALGAVFPEEMQWLRMGWLREKKQVEYNPQITPKVEAYESFINSDGCYTLRGAFKTLGLKPNIATEKLREDKVLYYLQENNVPYQQYLDRGYFVVKMIHNDKKNKDYPQTYVTPKGLDWLRNKYCTTKEMLVN